MISTVGILTHTVNGLSDSTIYIKTN